MTCAEEPRNSFADFTRAPALARDHQERALGQEEGTAGMAITQSREITTPLVARARCRTGDRAGVGVGQAVGHGSCSPRSREFAVCVVVCVVPGQGVMGKIAAAS